MSSQVTGPVDTPSTIQCDEKGTGKKMGFPGLSGGLGVSVFYPVLHTFKLGEEGYVFYTDTP